MALVAIGLPLGTGCANRSSGSGGGGANDVEPKPAERLSETAVPADFTFATTEQIDLAVNATGRHDGFVVVVLEPGTPAYDPHRAVKKALVEAGASFAGTVRIAAGASTIPVVIFENGVLDFTEVTIVDGRAETSR